MGLIDHQSERSSKRRCRGLAHVLERRGRCAAVQFDLFLYRCHRYPVDSARNDKLEVRQVSRDVEREAVPGNPVAGVNAD